MSEGTWLLLIHQIPPKPDYFRVKIRRRLHNVGAVAIKNSVYVLPNTEQTQEDFQWFWEEIKAEGGDATVCEAHFVEGLSDEQITGLFQTARDEDYAEIAEEAQKHLKAITENRAGTEERAGVAGQMVRLKRRLAEVAIIDFFEAPGRKQAEKLLSELEAAIRTVRPITGTVEEESLQRDRPQAFHGRTWVTRKGIHVDRMASAWLIRRFIDPEGQFKFVPSRGYRPQAGEVRFDMFEAEFTHEGERCTFEVLMDRFGLEDPALHTIAEIVHDIDLKDSRFSRQETPGMELLIAGIAMNHKEDEARLARGCAVFEDLYECFRRSHEGLSSPPTPQQQQTVPTKK